MAALGDDDGVWAIEATSQWNRFSKECTLYGFLHSVEVVCQDRHDFLIGQARVYFYEDRLRTHLPIVDVVIGVRCHLSGTSQWNLRHAVFEGVQRNLPPADRASVRVVCFTPALKASDVAFAELVQRARQVELEDRPELTREMSRLPLREEEEDEAEHSEPHAD